MRKEWSKEEEETIKRLAKEGKSRKEIADALVGRNYYHVIKKIKELYYRCEIDYIPKVISGGWQKPR